MCLFGIAVTLTEMEHFRCIFLDVPRIRSSPASQLTQSAPLAGSATIRRQGHIRWFMKPLRHFKTHFEPRKNHSPHV